MFKNRKVLWLVFLFFMLVIVGVYYMPQHFIKAPSDNADILLLVGSAQFKLDKRYLYSDQLKKGKRKIRDEAVVDYFSFDFFYPSLSWVERELDLPGWGNKVAVYVSKTPPFDFKRVVSLQSVVGPQKSEDEFNSDVIKKYSMNRSKASPSSSEQDLYIYGDYEAYLSCKKINKFDPPSPSCKLVFAYRNMEVSASFSREHKFEFLKIKASIEKMLSSFDTTGVEK